MTFASKHQQALFLKKLQKAAHTFYNKKNFHFNTNFDRKVVFLQSNLAFENALMHHMSHIFFNKLQFFPTTFPTKFFEPPKFFPHQNFF